MNFIIWLLARQRETSTALGDLAEDIVVNGIKINSIKDLEQRMRSQGASNNALQALDTALYRYKTEKRGGTIHRLE